MLSSIADMLLARAQEPRKLGPSNHPCARPQGDPCHRHRDVGTPPGSPFIRRKRSPWSCWRRFRSNGSPLPPATRRGDVFPGSAKRPLRRGNVFPGSAKQPLRRGNVFPGSAKRPLRRGDAGRGSKGTFPRRSRATIDADGTFPRRSRATIDAEVTLPERGEVYRVPKSRSSRMALPGPAADVRFGALPLLRSTDHR